MLEDNNFNRSIICVDDEEGVLESYRDVLTFDPKKDLFAEILKDDEQESEGEYDVTDGELSYTLFLAKSGEEAVKIVEKEKLKGNNIAAGFFDMRMPGGMDGYETIKRIKEIDPRVFCAIVTAFYDRELEQIRQLFIDEHQDELLYFKKPFSALELRQSALNMTSAWNRKRTEEKQVNRITEAYEQLKAEIEERKRAQEDLQKTQDLLIRAKDEWEEAFNTINDAITIHDLDFNIIRANMAAEKLFNVPLKQLLRQKCYKSYHGGDTPPEWCLGCKLHQLRLPVIKELYEPHLGKYIEIKILPRLDKNSKLTGLVHIIRDIDDRKKAEQEQERLHAELIHAQKMEIVGRLAGGVAHDFNNLLSPIIGYSELSLLKLPNDHLVKEYVSIIREAGQRAANVVKQLLAFSRKQVLEMKPAHLNSIVENMTKMLGRLIGEDITIELHTKKQTQKVMVDTVQIEQILMNMAVNARDAMPSGGRFIIAVSDVEITDNSVARLRSIKPGLYVLLRVSDTGSGIEPKVLEKIFEPFFTTKETDKGTGLGLAMVYGVVKQHNGYIYVESKVEEGTTFEVYLPVTHEDLEETAEVDIGSMPHGTETVLVAEDDQSIRKLIQDTLQPLGYNLLEASNGTKALQKSKTFAGKIDVLLTDVVMPGLDGRELADKLNAARPGIKVIFMSGYTDEVIARHGMVASEEVFMQKPVSPRILANKLRAVLDEE